MAPPTHGPPSVDISTHLLDIVERLTIIEQMNAAVITEQSEAKVSRRGIHSKLEDINTEITGVKADVKILQEKVSDVAPIVREHERIRQNISGGLWVTGTLGAIVLMAVGFVLKDAWVWIIHHIRWG